MDRAQSWTPDWWRLRLESGDHAVDGKAGHVRSGSMGFMAAGAVKSYAWARLAVGLLLAAGTWEAQSIVAP